MDRKTYANQREVSNIERCSSNGKGNWNWNREVLERRLAGIAELGVVITGEQDGSEVLGDVDVAAVSSELVAREESDCDCHLPGSRQSLLQHRVGQ